MKLKFKQKAMSIMGKYEILDEKDQVVYKVQGKLSMPKRFEIMNAGGELIGELKSKFFDFLPTFRLFINGQEIGRVKKKFRMLGQAFDIDCNGWQIEGDIFGWDYNIVDVLGNPVATLNKQVFNLFDVYELYIVNPQDALMVLMVVLAIDAEKANQ